MPLVAVSLAHGTRYETGVPVFFLSEAYVQALIGCGVTPVLIPSTLPLSGLREIFERCDGVLLTGGGDMNPLNSQVGTDDPAYQWATELDMPRDHAELALTQWAHAEDKPLFGVCRGHQVMNVALGGALWMDVPAQIGDSVNHNSGGNCDQRPQIMHPVDVVAGSRLAGIVGAGSFPVNSIHHQAIRTLAPALRTTATAPDGVIEAIEAPDKRFFMGVQWHPEELFTQDARMLGLFQAFADSLR